MGGGMGVSMHNLNKKNKHKISIVVSSLNRI